MWKNWTIMKLRVKKVKALMKVAMKTMKMMSARKPQIQTIFKKIELYKQKTPKNKRQKQPKLQVMLFFDVI